MLKDIEIQKIDEVTVMVDPKNAEHNRGFAYIKFQTHLDAKTAFKKLQEDLPTKFQNLKVAWAEPLNEPDEEEVQKVSVSKLKNFVVTSSLGLGVLPLLSSSYPLCR